MLATCLGCGCACDDIELHIEANRIVAARNACALGAAWYGDGSVPSRALVRGKESSLEDALRAASAILAGASRPLVFLAPDLSCEAQRAAIAIADSLRATIDSVTTASAVNSVLAAQEAGRASATLGEIRNRADVVVFWGVDTARRYPRFWTRYAPEPSGLHVAGRRSRTVISVDVGTARGPEDADLRVALTPEREVETLTELTAAIGALPDRGADPAGSAKASRARLAPHGDPALMDALLRGKYIAILVDAEADDEQPADRGRAAALTALAQALNGPTRCALIALRGGGNRSGADACLTAQTGYPMAVDFARGYPRYRPHEGAAQRTQDGVDAVLVVGSAALIPADLASAITTSAVVIGPRATSVSRAAVAIDTAVPGIHESGTALRMDDVPLPLGAAIAGPPAAAEIVARLGERLRQ
jgi:formylmethanofuran dehydrogenase subunit B